MFEGGLVIYVIVLHHLQLNPLQERGAAPLSLRMNYPRCVCLTHVLFVGNDISTDFQVNLYFGGLYLPGHDGKLLFNFI